MAPITRKPASIDRVPATRSNVCSAKRAELIVDAKPTEVRCECTSPRTYELRLFDVKTSALFTRKSGFIRMWRHNTVFCMIEVTFAQSEWEALNDDRWT